VGRSPDPGTCLYRSSGGWPLYPTNFEGTTFLTYSFTNGIWTPTNPIVPLGEAVWVLQPPKLSAQQTVSGQPQFAIRSATYASMDLEYTDALDSSSPWLFLTNVVGSGGVTTVADATATNGVAQRFYRLSLRCLPFPN
jgi:hypothetical protein